MRHSAAVSKLFSGVGGCSLKHQGRLFSASTVYGMPPSLHNYIGNSFGKAVIVILITKSYPEITRAQTEETRNSRGQPFYIF
jgi:hypothetical protein